MIELIQIKCSFKLFKGSFFYCEGPNIRNVRNKTDCLTADPRNVWVNRAYNFDDLGQALMALFVLSSKDGWVNIMYTGLDAVGVDQQVILFRISIRHSEFERKCGLIRFHSQLRTTPSGG